MKFSGFAISVLQPSCQKGVHLLHQASTSAACSINFIFAAWRVIIRLKRGEQSHMTCYSLSGRDKSGVSPSERGEVWLRRSLQPGPSGQEARRHDSLLQWEAEVGEEAGVPLPKVEEVLAEGEGEEDRPCSWEEVWLEGPQTAQRGALGKENLQGEEKRYPVC